MSLNSMCLSWEPAVSVQHIPECRTLATCIPITFAIQDGDVRSVCGTETLWQNCFCLSVFVDFCSAFNAIQPLKLQNKLHHLGLNTSLCNWNVDFLTIWTQNVRVNKHTSSTYLINTRTPLECVLTPLLYTLFTHVLLLFIPTSLLNLSMTPQCSSLLTTTMRWNTGLKCNIIVEETRQPPYTLHLQWGGWEGVALHISGSDYDRGPILSALMSLTLWPSQVLCRYDRFLSIRSQFTNI